MQHGWKREQSMSSEEPVDTRIVWSPDELPIAEAEALQAAEQKKKRTPRAPKAASASGDAPAKKRGRKPKAAATAATPDAAKPPVEPAADGKAASQPPKEAAPAAEAEPGPSAPQPATQPKPESQPQAQQQQSQAQPAPQIQQPPAQQPQAQQPKQQQQGAGGEGLQQPLSRRQLRRQQWLANRAARMAGKQQNFASQSPQGNRRPPEQMQAQQRYEPPQPAVPRNPDLPEYKLQDIHSWDNAMIVERMMPNANAEDLGAMKRHEIIFAAIRNYLSRGGAVMASGCLKVEKEGYGFLRSAKTNFLACPEDVFIPQQQIRRHALRTGDIVEGPVRDPRDKDRYFVLGNVVAVNGKTPSEAARIVHFENLTPTFPTRRIVLETVPGEVSMRVVDLFTPIGFGQRGLIVAPPRVGKTVLLQKMANAITHNHPEAILIVLLIDERPEEVTDMQRNTKAMVLSSTFDEEPQHHVDVADMVIEMSRRQAENGKDVIILLDSITRLARAYNTVQPHSGKILTGGVDALALHRPKRFFGAARNIEGGGSLTILATALIDTGSRMDEVIFEEFKGTGNMELVLDRGLADKRIFPAIDIEKSGTRKEDLLLAPVELEKTWALRRVLADAGPERAMQSVLGGMMKFKSNPEFLLSLDLKNL